MSFINKTTVYIIWLIIAIFNFVNVKALSVEIFNKEIKTKYFNIIYHDSNYKIANFLATKADDWAEDIFKFYGFKPSIRINFYVPHQSNTVNAFSNYDHLYLLTNRAFEFHRPVAQEWLEDVFKHELNHNIVSLGNASKLEIYSGLDLAVKNLTNSGWLQEGSSVMIESKIGYSKKSGRLNSENYLSDMNWKVDKGWEIDFWKVDDFSAGGDRYLDGSHFMLYISERFGLDNYKKMLKDYLSSYYLQLRYNFNEFVAKQQSVSEDDLLFSFKLWLLDRSKQATPKEALITGDLYKEESNILEIVDIDEQGKFYFVVASSGMMKLKSYNLTQQTYQDAKTEFSTSLGGTLPNFIKTGTDTNPVYYYKYNFGKAFGLPGVNSYYMQEKPSLSLINNFGVKKLEETKDVSSFVFTDDGLFFVKLTLSDFELNHSITNSFNEISNVVINKNNSMVIDNLKYSKADNLVYFAANKIGEEQVYIYGYNTKTNKLQKLVKGSSPYIRDGVLYFISNTEKNPRLNIYALTLSTNKIVMVSNLKYEPQKLLSYNKDVYYTAKGGTIEEEKTSLYKIKFSDYANKEANELLAINENLNLDAINKSIIPNISKEEDRGKPLNPLAIYPEPSNWYFALNGEFYASLRSKNHAWRLKLGITDIFYNESILSLPLYLEDNKSIKHTFKDYYDFDKKAYSIQLDIGGTLFSDMISTADSPLLSIKYDFKPNDLKFRSRTSADNYSLYESNTAKLDKVLLLQEKWGNYLENRVDNPDLDYTRTNFLNFVYDTFYATNKTDGSELKDNRNCNLSRYGQYICDLKEIVGENNVKTFTYTVDPNKLPYSPIHEINEILATVETEERYLITSSKYTYSNYHNLNVSFALPVLTQSYKLMPYLTFVNLANYNSVLETRVDTITDLSSFIGYRAIFGSSYGTINRISSTGYPAVASLLNEYYTDLINRGRINIINKTYKIQSKKTIEGAYNYSSLVFLWNNYNLVLRPFYIKDVIDTNYRYTENNIKYSNKNKESFGVNIRFFNIFDNVKSPYNLVNLDLLEKITLNINYINSNRSNQIFSPIQEIYSPEYDVNIYSNLSVNSKESGIIYNIFNDLKYKTNILSFNVAKEFSYSPYWGFSNFGINSIAIKPQFAYTILQSNVYLVGYENLNGNFKVKNHLYALTGIVGVNILRLSPEIHFTVYKQKNVLSVADTASGVLKNTLISIANDHDTTNLDNTYTGFSVNAILRF